MPQMTENANKWGEEKRYKASLFPKITNLFSVQCTQWILQYFKVLPRTTICSRYPPH